MCEMKVSSQALFTRLSVGIERIGCSEKISKAARKHTAPQRQHPAWLCRSQVIPEVCEREERATPTSAVSRRASSVMRHETKDKFVLFLRPRRSPFYFRQLIQFTTSIRPRQYHTPDTMQFRLFAS